MRCTFAFSSGNVNLAISLHLSTMRGGVLGGALVEVEDSRGQLDGREVLWLLLRHAPGHLQHGQGLFIVLQAEMHHGQQQHHAQCRLSFDRLQNF